MVSLITVAPIEYSINICQMGHLQLPDTHLITLLNYHIHRHHYLNRQCLKEAYLLLMTNQVVKYITRKKFIIYLSKINLRLMQFLINNCTEYTKIHLTDVTPSIGKHLIFSNNDLNDEGLAGNVLFV
jgi:hypothetical protein